MNKGRRGPSSRNGFSLMEVLVAVVIAAALSVSLTMLLQQGARYLEDAESRLEHVDMAQSYLIERPFFTEQGTTPQWVRFADSMGIPGRKTTGSDPGWKLDLERTAPRDLYILQTKNTVGTMSWIWVAP